jgi:hypothetical protein
MTSSPIRFFAIGLRTGLDIPLLVALRHRESLRKGIRDTIFAALTRFPMDADDAVPTDSPHNVPLEDAAAHYAAFAHAVRALLAERSS